MGLIMRRNLMAAKSGYTAKDYVQNGLVAMWDGIENSGWGVHDPNATVWKDLVGSRDLLLTQYGTWGEDFLQVKGEGNGLNGGNGANQGNRTNLLTQEDCRTLQGCFSATTWGIVFYSATQEKESDRVDNSGSAYAIYVFDGDNANDRTVSFPSSYRYNKADLDVPLSVSYNYDQKIAWINGEVTQPTSLIRSMTYDFDNRHTDGICIGGFSNRNSYRNSSNCKVRNVRIYNRALTADEIAHNYAVDKARFNLPDAA